MTTTQTSTKTFRNAILAGAATFAALAGVNSANALPIIPIPINFPPVASFTAAPNPAIVGDNTIFNGSASTDVDGSIAKYEWDLNGDGVFEVRSTVFSTANHRFTTPGTSAVGSCKPGGSRSHSRALCEESVRPSNGVQVRVPEDR